MYTIIMCMIKKNKHNNMFPTKLCNSMFAHSYTTSTFFALLIAIDNINTLCDIM